MAPADNSLSLSDSNSLKLEPWPKLLFTSAIVFAFLGIVGAPYFFSATSFSISFGLFLSALMLGISRGPGRKSLNAAILRRWSGRALITGFFFILVAVAGAGSSFPGVLFVLGFGLTSFGGLWLIWNLYRGRHSGDINAGAQDNSLISRGAAGWL